MKSLFAVGVLSALLAAGATDQESPKLKVAVIRLDNVMNSGNYYERVRFLSADKDILAALRKIDADINDLQKQIVDTMDPTKLNELGGRMQFLNQKRSLLLQGIMNRESTQDVQAVLRDFVIQNYRHKYHIITQDIGQMFGQFIWRTDTEVNDITDEVTDKFREHMDRAIDEQLGETNRGSN